MELYCGKSWADFYPSVERMSENTQFALGVAQCADQLRQTLAELAGFGIKAQSSDSTFQQNLVLYYGEAVGDILNLANALSTYAHHLAEHPARYSTHSNLDEQLMLYERDMTAGLVKGPPALNLVQMDLQPVQQEQPAFSTNGLGQPEEVQVVPL